MSALSQGNSTFGGFRPGARKSVRVSQQNLVRTGFLASGQELPLVITPNQDNVNLIRWAQGHRDFIDRHLRKSGGVLFRDFGLESLDEFERFATVVSGGLLEYRERSSPRSHLAGNVYTSTDHPSDQTIYLHNEQSYNLTWPLKILFFCKVPAQRGGETPIADCRKVLARLSPAVRERFAEKHYRYVRNFGDGFGLTWQTAFQTEDRREVERYCRDSDIAFEWKEGDRLKTWQVRRALIEHPTTGEPVWFNHATFFHVSTLAPAIRDALRQNFSDEDLPNQTFYGDGAPIEDEVLDELRAAYEAETVAFNWQKGDVLLLDNALVAHSRNPFEGPRQVAVSMGEPFISEPLESALS